ncbi:MAG: DNA/RNA non-specific endonuclease [Terricaulis sp.]
MRRALVVIAALFALTPNAFAACAGVYLQDAAPRFVQQATPEQTTELCFAAFAVEHSGQTRTPLWSAEHLTAASVESARALPRRDDFHAERTLPRNQRAELTDYVRSGYDRGHMAPSGDMPTREAQDQSFTLANIAPQAASLNRGAWEDVESATRNLAERNGELYVVTGPVFARGAPALIHNRVRVPDQIFKAVYDPRTRQAGAYIAANASGSRVRVISIDALQRLINADVFPALPATTKSIASDMLGVTRERYASAANVIGQR